MAFSLYRGPAPLRRACSMFLPNVFRGLNSQCNVTLSRKDRRRLARRSRTTQKLLLERLEDWSVPSVYSITTTADSGPGSLRQAIIDANTNATGTAANLDLI